MRRAAIVGDGVGAVGAAEASRLGEREASDADGAAVDGEEQPTSMPTRTPMTSRRTIRQAMVAMVPAADPRPRVPDQTRGLTPSHISD